MVRMLGFSNEDKQRIGLAQQGPGKGVVRGVLGLPGRLVGGILGGSSSESAVNVGSDNQVISSLVLVYFPFWCTSFVFLRGFHLESKVPKINSDLNKYFSPSVLCRYVG